MKKNIHFLILFLATIIEISNGQNYIWPHYKEITGTFQESAFQSSLVASDFGPRRVPQYDWHSGIDYNCAGCENKLALSVLNGTFYYREQGGEVRYVVINGTSDIAYLHLFTTIPQSGICRLGTLVGKTK